MPDWLKLANASKTFFDDTGATLNVSANITSSGNLVKTGAGALNLTGNNTYTGTTTVNGGTLNAGATGALGATSGVTVNTGGTLLLSGSGNLDRVNNYAALALPVERSPEPAARVKEAARLSSMVLKPAAQIVSALARSP